MGEARARGAGSAGGSGAADAMLALVAAEVAAVLDGLGAAAGVRCAAVEALLWLQVQPFTCLHDRGYWSWFVAR